ncbi:MinD/ParA family protein [Halorubrum ezzemoulense]|uniref:MinD/ParA family ATP-binding protein n=1 Tax=Halorubrum ezzemoulense TaxID=337243 RepID=UPI00232BD66F|nr:MinD/ParA family protein [Halorubrum ezzemoulense]MDB2282654.1 MinD/ParA family protein [Halorubrum ezzemoulense]
MNHTVAVTGGTRATAKTTSVAILGAVFADAGADVLLVDCDLANPSLAAALGIPEPDATLRDVFAGRATLDEAIHTGPAGAEVLPGGQFAVPDATAIRDFVEAIDGFDVVVCDTGDPFSDATAGACDAADGAVVVSTPDDAARRNTTAVHGSLREHGRPLLGTVLTRVQGDADTPEWDCDILATIPESDAVASGAMAVLDSPSDPGAERYRELARGVYRRLRDDHDGTASNAALWLPQPVDPFLTPAVAAGTSGDADTPSNDESGEPDSAAAHDDTPSDAGAVADSGNGSTGDVNDSTPEADTPAEEPTEDSDSGITLTRRGALAALTAAVGGVSAGILNTRETPEIEAFGYGGRPVTSNESTPSTTNTTTSAGSLSTGGSNRTESMTETGSGDTERDLSSDETGADGADNSTEPVPTGNTTESGGVGNTTDPVSTGNTTESGGVGNTTDPVSTGNTTESGGVGNTTGPVSTGNTTDTNDEPAPGAEPTNETSDTEDSPTSGDDSSGNTGGSGTGDSTGSDDGSTGGSDTGTSDDGSTGGGDTGTSDDGSTGGDDSGTGDDGTGSDDGDTGTGSDGNTEDGDTGTGGDGNTEDSDTGTGGDGTDSGDGGDGTDDTTDAPSDPGDEQFGTVGYGEGGYGGVA